MADRSGWQPWLRYGAEAHNASGLKPSVGWLPSRAACAHSSGIPSAVKERASQSSPGPGSASLGCDGRGHDCASVRSRVSSIDGAAIRRICLYRRFRLGYYPIITQEEASGAHPGLAGEASGRPRAHT